MGHTHEYATRTEWTGNTGSGTARYDAYVRRHTTSAAGRPDLPASSDPAFRGDADRWNPELLLVAALSQCHMLSYLHRCALGGVTVMAYVDDAVGTMREDGRGGGRFEAVTLRPVVTVAAAAMADRAQALHAEAAARCFIAASVDFPVGHEPAVVVAEPAAA
jgi:organic hydroperoxide reductase OsmC/OhrA